MSYYVIEVFRTLQGEGFHVGRASVFVRFAGCNLWTGHDEHRERDAAKNDVECPRWCDTDFRKGRAVQAADLADQVRALASNDVRHIVLTGGEPLLQLDAHLVHALRRALPFATLAIETNGTMRPKHGVTLDWVCVSPKSPTMDGLEITRADELKVVVPDYDPRAFDAFEADHRFVSPRARALPGSVGRSIVDADNTMRAATFCIDNPRWRLSLQTHKQVGIP